MFNSKRKYYLCDLFLCLQTDIFSVYGIKFANGDISGGWQVSR
jgi:hypothetical protein